MTRNYPQIDVDRTPVPMSNVSTIDTDVPGVIEQQLTGGIAAHSTGETNR